MALDLPRENNAETTQSAAANPGQRRIVALDGVRGLMTILVVLSHYFAETPGGIKQLAVGWIAVDMFFVLSGFLVGRLIHEKYRASNFLAVFFLRRICRTFPIYFVCLAAIVVIAGSTLQKPGPVPLWSYFLFVQNFFMAASADVGTHYLAPTWTLAVEEHFYLVIPFVFLAVPRKALLPALLLIAAASVGIRAVALMLGYPSISVLALAQGRADILAIGVTAAVVLTGKAVNLCSHIMLLRVFPIVALLGASALAAADSSGKALAVAGHTLVALGCASFLLSLVLNTPEAERMKSPRLRFFGDNSYAIYLVHLPVLWAMHGVILGSQPGLLTPLQCAVTLASLPVTVAIGWLLTKWIEVPITSFGRNFTWSAPKSPIAAAKVRPEVVSIQLEGSKPVIGVQYILIAAAVALFVFTFFSLSI